MSRSGSPGFQGSHQVAFPTSPNFVSSKGSSQLGSARLRASRHQVGLPKSISAAVLFSECARLSAVLAELGGNGIVSVAVALKRALDLAQCCIPDFGGPTV